MNDLDFHTDRPVVRDAVVPGSADCSVCVDAPVSAMVLGDFPWAYPVPMGTGTESDRSATVLQAEGLVSVQVDCPVGDALQLMADRAVVQGMTIEDVALAVVDRSIRFGPITN